MTMMVATMKRNEYLGFVTCCKYGCKVAKIEKNIPVAKNPFSCKRVQPIRSINITVKKYPGNAMP
jgi:hypothetical protein